MSLIVDFDTGTWTDPWVEKKDPSSKLLFIYLWTNNHKSVAGIYPISLATIQKETKLSIKQINCCFQKLLPKVKYDYLKEIVWVVNHVRRSYMRTGKISPKILIAIEKALLSLNGHYFIKEFLQVYAVLEIRYPYPIDDRVSLYPSSKDKDSGKGKGSGKGSGKDKEVEENKIEILPRFSECMKVLELIPGYPFDPKKDQEILMARTEEYPEIDLLCLINNWKVYLMDHPLTSRSNPRSQLNNQFEFNRKYGRCQKGGRSGPEQQPKGKYADIGTSVETET